MEDPTYNPIVTAAVSAFPATVQDPGAWTVPKVAALVRDIAMELYPEGDILAKHKVTPAEYAVLKENQFFKNALEQEVLAWHSPQSATKRLALEAAMSVEVALPTVAARLRDSREPLADVVSLLKVLAEMAGSIGSKSAGMQQPASSQFKITINLGADTMARDVTPSIVVEHDPTAANALALQPLPERTYPVS